MLTDFVNDSALGEGARTSKGWVKNSKQTWQIVDASQNQQTEIQQREVVSILRYEKSMQTNVEWEWLASVALKGLGTVEGHKQIANQQCHVAAKKTKQISIGNALDRVSYIHKPQEAIIFPHPEPEKLQLVQVVSSFQKTCIKKGIEIFRESETDLNKYLSGTVEVHGSGLNEENGSLSLEAISSPQLDDFSDIVFRAFFSSQILVYSELVHIGFT